MSWNPSTAYGDEHQWLDFVEDVTWVHGETSETGLKGRWGDFDTADLQSMAAGLGLSSNAAAVVVWQPTPSDVDQEDRDPTFAPKAGHILRRTTKGNEGWVVMGVLESRFGHWSLGCEREVVNATT